MNRLISQGHAIRSTRARSRVTHFMRSPSVTWSRLSCRAILSVRRFRRRDEMALNERCMASRQGDARRGSSSRRASYNAAACRAFACRSRMNASRRYTSIIAISFGPVRRDRYLLSAIPTLTPPPRHPDREKRAGVAPRRSKTHMVLRGVCQRSLLDPLAQRRKRAIVERNVVEGFLGDRFGDRPRLRAITTEHNHAGVVVFHRQAAIALGPSHFAYNLVSPLPTHWH